MTGRKTRELVKEKGKFKEREGVDHEPQNLRGGKILGKKDSTREFGKRCESVNNISVKNHIENENRRHFFYLNTTRPFCQKYGGGG